MILSICREAGSGGHSRRGAEQGHYRHHAGGHRSAAHSEQTLQLNIKQWMKDNLWYHGYMALFRSSSRHQQVVHQESVRYGRAAGRRQQLDQDTAAAGRRQLELDTAAGRRQLEGDMCVHSRQQSNGTASNSGSLR